MRVHFDLVSPTETIRDAEGIDVLDVAEAEREAAEAVREMLTDHPDLFHDLKGWRMEIVDGRGDILSVPNLAFIIAKARSS